LTTPPPSKPTEEKFYLTDLIKVDVRHNGKKIGKLADLIAKGNGTPPVVTDIVVSRPFGDPSLIIPWSNVTAFSANEITVNIESVEKHVQEPPENTLLLKDYIIDKKILDVQNREVEMVYDLILVKKKDRLYVSAVDISRGRLLKKLHLGFLTDNTPEAVKNSTLPWSYIQPLENISSFSGDIRLKVLREKISELPAEDVADILEVLEEEQRTEIFESLEPQAAAEALEATEPRVQRQILSTANFERIGEIFRHLSPAEIADIISIMPGDDAEELEKILDPRVVDRVKAIVAHHDVPASTLALHRFLAFPGDTLVEDAFIRFRKEAPRSFVTMYIYIVDEEKHLQGVLDINELLQADPETTLEKIMSRDVVTVEPSTMRGEVVKVFQRYHFRALPVVDKDRKIVGVIKEKDAFQD
jgi:magnesium transporter